MAYSGPQINGATVVTDTAGVDNISMIKTVASGVGLIVLYNASGGSGTPTISDTQGLTWTASSGVDQNVTGRRSVVWTSNSTASGSITITINAGASTNMRGELLEMTAAIANDQTSHLRTLVAGNSFPAAADGTVIDTAANAFIIASCAITGTVTTWAVETTPATFTSLSSRTAAPVPQFLNQYLQSESAQTNVQGTATTTGTARTGIAAIRSVTAVAAGGGGRLVGGRLTQCKLIRGRLTS